MTTNNKKKNSSSSSSLFDKNFLPSILHTKSKRSDDSNSRRSEAFCFRIALIVVGLLLISTFCTFDFALQSLQRMITPQGSVMGYLSSNHHFIFRDLTSSGGVSSSSSGQRVWLNTNFNEKVTSVANKKAFNDVGFRNKMTILDDVCEQSSIVKNSNNNNDQQNTVWCIGTDRQLSSSTRPSSLQIKRIDLNDVIKHSSSSSTTTSSFKSNLTSSVRSMWITPSSSTSSTPLPPLASASPPFPSEAVEILSVAEIPVGTKKIAATILLRDVSFNSIYSVLCLGSEESSSSSSWTCTNYELLIDGNSTDSSKAMATDSCSLSVFAYDNDVNALITASCTSENKKVRRFSSWDSSSSSYPSFEDNFPNNFLDGDDEAATTELEPSPKIFVSEILTKTGTPTTTISSPDSLIKKSWAEIPHPASSSSTSNKILSFSDVVGIPNELATASSSSWQNYHFYTFALLNDTTTSSKKNYISAVLIDITDSVSSLSLSSSSSSSTLSNMHIVDGSSLELSSNTFGELYATLTAASRNDSLSPVSSKRWIVDDQEVKDLLENDSDETNKQPTKVSVSFFSFLHSTGKVLNLKAVFSRFHSQTVSRNTVVSFPTSGDKKSAILLLPFSGAETTTSASSSSSSFLMVKGNSSSTTFSSVFEPLTTMTKFLYVDFCSSSSSESGSSATTTTSEKREKIFAMPSSSSSSSAMGISHLLQQQQQHEESPLTFSFIRKINSELLQCPFGQHQQAVVSIMTNTNQGEKFTTTIALVCNSLKLSSDNSKNDDAEEQSGILSIVFFTQPTSAMFGQWNTKVYEDIPTFLSSPNSAKGVRGN